MFHVIRRFITIIVIVVVGFISNFSNPRTLLRALSHIFLAPRRHRKGNNSLDKLQTIQFTLLRRVHYYLVTRPLKLPELMISQQCQLM